MPQCWLSNSTAQAIAWIRVKPEVLVSMPFNLSQLVLSTCLATKECFDLISGNGPLSCASIALGGTTGVSLPAKISLSSFHKVFTPSIIFCTSWTSEYPSLCLFEISYVCPVWPPDSPLVPLGWRCNSSHLLCRAYRPAFVHPGRSTWTDALIPVPRFVGHEWM